MFPGHEHYAAWAREGERWTPLGEIDAGEEERSLRIAESDALAAPPDELRITRERVHPASPAGPTVLSWRPSAR